MFRKFIKSGLEEGIFLIQLLSSLDIFSVYRVSQNN